MIEIETWKSNNSKKEIHHYLGDSYLFGFSTDCLSKELYEKILALVIKELNKKSTLTFNERS